VTGAEIKRIMAALDWTQQQLADELGVARNTINRWANDLEPIPRIAEVAIGALARNGKRRPKERIKK
jgi:transcriptional regulator with XRE-family HTH domain